MEPLMNYKVNRLDPDFKAYISRLEDACWALGPADKHSPDALGLDVIPVIPVELPVEEFHQLTKDATGQWVPRLDSKGQPIPFSPKAPAYWQVWQKANGSDEIRRKSIRWGDDVEPYDPKNTRGHICTAKAIGHLIGLALKLSTELVAIDFDVKPYILPSEQVALDAATTPEAKADALAPAKARMEAEVDAWVEANPIAKQTRAERTPSGGYHFYFRVQDCMQSWAAGISKDGKQITHVQFALAADGTHRGEVLCGRICVCAPTQNGRGPYALLDEDFAYVIAEVPNLEALGIHPVARKRRERTSKDGTRQTLMREAPEVPDRPLPPDDYDPPQLVTLLGKKAVGVMTGTMPYGPDRSTNLAGFIRELYGWIAFLHDQALPYEVGYEGDGVETVIHKAAEILGIDDSDRVDRIIRSVDLRCSNLSVPAETALNRYRTQAGGELPSTFTGLKETERNPLELCAASLRDVLVDTVALNLGKADLAFKLKELAGDFDEPLHVVKDLYKQLQDEDSTNEETASAISELVRLRSEGVDVSDILPLRLTNRLLSIRRTAEYDTPLLVTTLVAAASAALPLSSSINLSPVEDFTQCLSVWFLMLMESGEMKSPLMRRLIIDPYKIALGNYFPILRHAIAHTLANWALTGERQDEDLALPPEARRFIEAKAGRVADYLRFEKFKDPDTGEEGPPNYDQLCEYAETLLGPTPDLLITGGGTKQGIDSTFEACANWAGKGVLYLQDEMKAMFIKMARPAATELDFAQWLLTRYDGSGSAEAKADATRIRNYGTCRLAVLGGIQPDIYRDTLGDDDASGMTARFNAYEQPQVDQIFPDEFSRQDILESQALKDDTQALYAFLLAIPELTLTVSHDAFRRFQQFRRDAFGVKRAEVSNAGKSLANKGAGKVGRIAAVLHVIHHAVAANFNTNAATQIPQVVQLESVERAIKLHDLLFKQTLGVRLSSADNDPVAQVALRCHRAAKGKPDGVAISQLRKVFRGNDRPSPAETLAACQQLHDQGLGRLVPISYKGRDGHRYIHLQDL